MQSIALILFRYPRMLKCASESETTYRMITIVYFNQQADSHVIDTVSDDDWINNNSVDCLEAACRIIKSRFLTRDLIKKIIFK